MASSFSVVPSATISISTGSPPSYVRSTFSVSALTFTLYVPIAVFCWYLPSLIARIGVFVTFVKSPSGSMRILASLPSVSPTFLTQRCLVDDEDPATIIPGFHPTYTFAWYVLRIFKSATTSVTPGIMKLMSTPSVVIPDFVYELPSLRVTLQSHSSSISSYEKSSVSSSGGAFPPPWFGDSITSAPVSGTPIVFSYRINVSVVHPEFSYTFNSAVISCSCS